MTQANVTALEIFQSTAQTNCGECGLGSCMAFSLQVLQGLKRPEDCPYFDDQTADRLAAAPPAEKPEQADRRGSLLAELKTQISDVDFHDAARRLGGGVRGDRLAIMCLGKWFEVDKQGGLHSDAHVHDWVHLPILQYIVHGQGKDPTGELVTFAQLNGIRDWKNFFEHRCEKAFRDMAEEHPDLFLDLLDLFGHDHHVEGTSPDRSIMMYPLPKVPILFLYWRAEEEFEAKLTILLDRAVEANLGAEGTYLLVQGIVEMFRKIIARHV